MFLLKRLFIFYMFMTWVGPCSILAMEGGHKIEEKENIPPSSVLNNTLVVENNLYFTELPKETKIFKHLGPMLEDELNQLNDQAYNEIYLHGFYISRKIDDEYVCAGPLTISPAIFNPYQLELLSLRVCGLKPQHIRHISEFKSLRELDLTCNAITDAGVDYIILLEKLTTLSLSSNDISNAGLMKLLDMPHLKELDVCLNKKINDEVASELRQNNKLEKLIVRFTGMSRKIQREFYLKYEKPKYLHIK